MTQPTPQRVAVPANAFPQELYSVSLLSARSAVVTDRQGVIHLVPLTSGHGEASADLRGTEIAHFDEFEPAVVEVDQSSRLLLRHETRALVGPLDLAGATAVICSSSGLALSETEWRQYVGDLDYEPPCRQGAPTR